MASNALECDVCSNVFSDDHCPRILPCSHSFCSCCINGIIRRQKKTCPICRTVFTASSAENLMINRNLLDVAKQLSSTQIGTKTSSNDSEKSFLSVTNYFRENFKENSIKVVLADCQEALNEVLDATEVLKGMKDDIQDTNEEAERRIKRLQEVKRSSESISSNIDQNIEMMNKRLDVLLQFKEKMQDTNAKLESARDYTSAGILMDATEEVLNDVCSVVKDIKERLQQNKKETQDIQKAILDTNGILASLPVEKQGKSEEEPFINITASELRSSCGSIRGRPPREIFAVKTIEGKQMVAAVVPCMQISLYRLEEEVIPPQSYVIQHESLMEEPPQRACLVLGVDDTVLGRVIIRLTNKGNLALNFLHMCAGDLGPSYANSQLLHVSNKGEDSECVKMGEYVMGRGTSGKAVLPGVNWAREKKRKIYKTTPYVAGQVRGYISYYNASVFDIITRDDQFRTDKDCFGVVEEGLDILKDAIWRYPDISRVRIVNCGLMFCL